MTDTYAGYAELRSNLRSGSDADIAKAVAYGMRVKLYPLAGGQPAADDIRRCDRRRVRQHHPLRPALFPVTRPLRAERALAGKGQGDDRSAQVVRHRDGQALQPQPRTREIFEEATREARAWLDAKYETVFSPPYFEGSHWALPTSPQAVEGMQTNFAKPDSYPVDDRGVLYSFIYFSAKTSEQASST
jgi:hypothetical protein